MVANDAFASFLPKPTTKYGLLLDMDKGELSLYIDGICKGVAFTGLEGRGPLIPAVEAGTQRARRIRADFAAPLPEGWK